MRKSNESHVVDLLGMEEMLATDLSHMGLGLKMQMQLS